MRSYRRPDHVGQARHVHPSEGRRQRSHPRGGAGHRRLQWNSAYNRTPDLYERHTGEQGQHTSHGYNNRTTGFLTNLYTLTMGAITLRFAKKTLRPKPLVCGIRHKLRGRREIQMLANLARSVVAETGHSTILCPLLTPHDNIS